MEKRLYSLKEFTKYTGMGMSKARELAKVHECDFTVRVGNKIFIDIEGFNSYMQQCMQFGVPIC